MGTSYYYILLTVGILQLDASWVSLLLHPHQHPENGHDSL